MSGLSPESKKKLEAEFLARQKRKADAEAADQAATNRLIDQAAQDGIELSWTEASAALNAKRAEAAARESAQRRKRAEYYAERMVPETRTPSPSGRPKGTRKYGPEAIVEEFRRQRGKLKRNPTQEELANGLDKMGVRTLQEMLKDYGLSWPIE